MNKHKFSLYQFCASKNLAYRLMLLPLLICAALSGQVVFTEQQVVDSALKNSPSIKATQAGTQQQQQYRKSAFNLPNPEIVAESPTGEFYTVGVLQSLDFPSVYFKQHQVAKQEVEIASAGQQVTVNDVKYETRLLYSQLQYQLALVAKLRVQDSLYNLVKESAHRMFAAGQIDFLEKTYAESQYGEVHNKLISAEADAEVTRAQLQNISGIKQQIIPEPLQKSTPVEVTIVKDTNLFAANPLVNYYRQQQILSAKMISLERHRMLPGIVFGYLNQGITSTPVNLRFRAGITIPLWFWQYTGSIKAARFRYEQSTYLLSANQIRLTNQQLQAQGEYVKYFQSVTYYETTGMQQSGSLIESSKRMYTAGETDLVTHLRNMNDAYSIQINYLEALKNYNQSILFLHYTNGTL